MKKALSITILMLITTVASFAITGPNMSWVR